MSLLKIKHSTLRHIMATVALVLLSGLAFAMPDDKNQPIELTADAADINEAKNISIYTGNVDLRQGTMQILCDVLTVYHVDGNAERMVAEAKGAGQIVRFKQQTPDGLMKGRAMTVEYFVDKDEVFLIEKAWVKNVQDTMESDRITWDRTKGRIKGGKAAKGDSRVKFVIQPNNNKK